MSQLITQYFQADHKRLDLLFDQYKQLREDAPEQALQFLLRFQRDLELHIDWEEKQLFPLFEQRTGMMHGPTRVMCMEHVEINQLLNNLVSAEQEKSSLALGLLDDLETTLSGHNHKEEYILYPNLDKIASDDEKARVFLALA